MTINTDKKLDPNLSKIIGNRIPRISAMVLDLCGIPIKISSRMILILNFY